MDGEVVGCLACDLSAGREALPGGAIHQTTGWRVEHCIGPLGLGTLLVKPIRHVTAVADLTAAEAAELGPLLRLTAQVVSELTEPDQVYVCLWSHAGGEPAHIHFVVQPVSRQTTASYGGNHGPKLQVAMFNAATYQPDDAIATFAATARSRFTAVPNQEA